VADAQNLFLRSEGAGTLKVQGDRPRIERIAAKLIEGALRTASKGGVLVRWQLVEQADAHHWALSIHDGGDASVPALEGLITRSDDSQQPGSPQSASPGHGEGISSSVVKHLCELLDATLEYSRSNDATCVRVLFPCRYPVR
jgi:hypothetical protein